MTQYPSLELLYLLCVGDSEDPDEFIYLTGANGDRLTGANGDYLISGAAETANYLIGTNGDRLTGANGDQLTGV
jgi:hypothetical protein